MIKQLFMLVLLFAGLCINSYAQPKNIFHLKNQLSIKRSDELIILKRDWIEKQTGIIPAGSFAAIFTILKNIPLIIQHDDLNEDGEWDELSFLYSFSPKQKVSFRIIVTKKQFQKRVIKKSNLRFAKKINDSTYGADLTNEQMPAGLQGNDFIKNPLPLYQMEGPAWENDKVAFRLYFDARNGKDIFGKTTALMMMDTVGFNGDKFYHKSAHWGMDILKVGRSLGAGAIALRVPVPEKEDSLIRVGGNNIGKVMFKKICEGPVRSIFALHYNDWDLLNNGKKINVIEEISIWGGQYFYESKVKLENAPENTIVVTGIVNLHSDTCTYLKISNAGVLYSFARQSDNNDNAGLAVLAQKSSVVSVTSLHDKLADIKNTYIIELKANEQKEAKFRFYAGWEKTDGQFSTIQGFDAFMKKEAIFFSSPINAAW